MKLRPLVLVVGAALSVTLVAGCGGNSSGGASSSAPVAAAPTKAASMVAGEAVAAIKKATSGRIAVTQTASPRALPAEELATLVGERLASAGRPRSDLAGVYPSVEEALCAYTEAEEPLVAAGTITLAGEVAGLLRDARAVARP